MSNGVEANKETIEIDSSRMDEENQVKKQIPVAKANCNISPRCSSVGSGGPTTGVQGNENRSLPYTLKWINGKKKFQCKTCTKTCARMGDFNRHLLIHTGQQPFECEICKKRFTLNSSLKSHVRVHTDERPFSCQVSGKSFKGNPDVQKHLRIHTGEKPHRCKLLVNNREAAITQRHPSSTRTSVSSLKILISGNPIEIRWCTRWLIDSRSYLMMNSATFWLAMKLGRRQLVVSVNCVTDLLSTNNSNVL